MYKGELTYDELNGCYTITTAAKGYVIPYKGKRIKSHNGSTKKECRDYLLRFIDDFLVAGKNQTKFLHLSDGDKMLAEVPIESGERDLGPIIKIG